MAQPAQVLAVLDDILLKQSHVDLETRARRHARTAFRAGRHPDRESAGDRIRSLRRAPRSDARPARLPVRAHRDPVSVRGAARRASRVGRRAWAVVVFPRPLRRRAGRGCRAVRAAHRGRHALRPRQLRHEERARRDVVRRKGAAHGRRRAARTAGAAVCARTRKPAARSGPARSAAAGLLPDDAVGMLLPEPTSGVVWNANRGAITLEVTVRGRAAHVALQHQGTNAVERALPLLARLFEVEARARRRRRLDSARRRARRRRHRTSTSCRPSAGSPSIGGPIPAEDFDAEKQRLLAILESARSQGIDLEVRDDSGRPFCVDAARRRARAARCRARSPPSPATAPVFEMCPGLLETRFYAERGVPALAYGPGILAVSHGPREFVKIGRMMECAKIYALAAAAMLAWRHERQDARAHRFG